MPGTRATIGRPYEDSCGEVGHDGSPAGETAGIFSSVRATIGRPYGIESGIIAESPRR